MDRLAVRAATAQDIPAMRALWDECFPLDADFCGFFFENIFNLEFASVCEYSGEVCAMLHAFPYELRTPERSLSAKYIYGVGTGKRFRGLGAAGALLRAAESGCDLMMLIPQNLGLFEFYKRYGYSAEFYVDKYEALPAGAVKLDPATDADIPRINEIYERHMKGYIHAVRNREHWSQTMSELASSGGGICFFGDGYCAYYPEGDRAVISELFSGDAMAAEKIAGALRRPCTVIGIGEGTPIAAAKLLSCEARSAFSKCSRRYLNLMHN